MLHLCLCLLLFVSSWFASEPTETEKEDIRRSTLQITTFLTSALRLQGAQSTQLRSLTHQHLSAQTTGTAIRPYHTALQEVLQPEQYQRLLQLEAQPNPSAVIVQLTRLP
ncbi:hypothetical protein [Hymenobacter canadensis]|uniref:Uncharacterized protein n=1 Tax=Hymenobacter canadensis TaxID=2999067 RepID=A0ABY7LWY9_9BACT|nr:hypothetical protein [Hymenobacter canadensis]WBA44109.1 hypothetical protein O3303_19665 [Hymenobacter canadensis]